jgi:acetyl-CoA C-acetyltransferase
MRSWQAPSLPCNPIPAAANITLDRPSLRVQQGATKRRRDMADVVILGAARTAIGTFGGSLAGVAPADLGALAAREAMARAGIEPGRIGHVAFGHVLNTEPRDMYLSRVAAMRAGIPDSAPAMNVNRLCGSGAQAVVSVLQSLLLGDAEFGLAGGAESMSRAPYIVPAARWGQKMGDVAAMDMMLGALTCPFGTGHMGVTAENVAKDHGITREAQDAFALESQRRAAAAIAEGRFDSQIVPVPVQVKRETVNFTRDEHPKATSAEALAGLRAAFAKDGSVTAGNASGINDGAAALVLARADAAEGLKPLARILGYAHAGVDPRVMGIGPVPAVRSLLAKTGLDVADFDVIESNEAFAAQALAVGNELGFDPAKVNPNGGAIALGHPVGATGAILTVKALYELQRSGGRLALITMCIGGGQGIALAIERL